MKLQYKVLIILASIWAIICIGIIIDSEITLKSKYKQLEEKLAKKDILRVQKALDDKLNSLKLYTNSWSQWDSAYQFMLNKSDQFINSNFVPGTFTSSNLNFFLMYNPSGNLYYGKSYNLNSKKFIPIPEGLLDFLNKTKSFVIHPNVNSQHVGILKIPEGNIVMSSLPILTSDGKGPIHGSLLMGYFIKDNFYKSLANTVDMKIQFFPMPLPKNDALLNTAFQHLSTSTNAYFAIKNTSIAYGLMLIKDIHGEPVGLLRIEIPRDIYSEGIITIYHYLTIFVLLGVLILITMWFLLKSLVLNRMISVGKQVIDINSERKFYKRINISGNDEMTKMISSINSMLELIELTQEQLKYRISSRTKELEKLSHLNRSLFKEIAKQKSIETKIKEDDKLLRQIAYYDMLTGLPNRAFFNELLQQAIMNATHNENKLAILFIDADKFKKINDTYGHDFGDKFLIEIAYRLKKSVNATDVVARIGGDEFIVFLTNIEDRIMIDDAVIKLLENLTAVMQIDKISISPVFSVGISIFPEDGSLSEDLLKKADLAMYYAKKQPGSSYRYYDSVNVHTTSIS